jgi:phosphatidylinositol alpha-1,6-mannosyltransferase
VSGFDGRAPYAISRVPVPLLRFFSDIRLTEFYLPPFLAAGAMRHLVRGRPDVIHCGETLPSGAAGLMISRLFGIPYVVWFHDNPFGPVTRFGYPLRRFVAKNADGIATTCSFARDSIVAEGIDNRRVALITPGVDPDSFMPSDEAKSVRSRYGIEGKTVLFTVSRLLPHKGQDTVIRLMPELLKTHPDVVYLVGGCGGYRVELERLACEVGVSERVIFAGFIPQEEMAAHYSACDLFIMLNREVEGLSWEGFGLVLLEAAACGRPVIAGRAGGVADSVVDNETGFLVDPNNPAEVRDKIEMLLGDRDLAGRMGRNGMERAVNGFRWENSARKTVEFSARIVGQYRKINLSRSGIGTG